MKWKNARKEGCPEDNQQVLITVLGINHVAIYHKNSQSFKVKETPLIFFVTEQTIYWMEIPIHDAG